MPVLLQNCWFPHPGVCSIRGAISRTAAGSPPGSASLFHVLHAERVQVAVLIPHGLQVALCRLEPLRLAFDDVEELLALSSAQTQPFATPPQKALQGNCPSAAKGGSSLADIGPQGRAVPSDIGRARAALAVPGPKLAAMGRSVRRHRLRLSQHWPDFDRHRCDPDRCGAKLD